MNQQTVSQSISTERQPPILSRSSVSLIGRLIPCILKNHQIIIKKSSILTRTIPSVFLHYHHRSVTTSRGTVLDPSIPPSLAIFLPPPPTSPSKCTVWITRGDHLRYLYFLMPSFHAAFSN